MAESTVCPICLEEFTHHGDKCPKLLPCSHTLCLSCLGQLLRSHVRDRSLVQCPECRVSHRLSPSGPKGFPTNRYVLHVLDLEKKVTELETNAMEPLLCEIHQNPCVMFCLRKECWKALCPKCSIQDHLEHHLVSLAECLQELQELNEIKQEAVSTTESLKLYEKQFKEARQIIRGKETEAIKSIDTTATELKLMIERKSKELKEKVKHCCDNERIKINDILDKISSNIVFGTNIKNDISQRSERNISKGVQELSKFKTNCSALKALAHLNRSEGNNYKVVRFQKNGNQVEYSSLIGDIVITSHEVSQLPGQQHRAFLEESSQTQTVADRRASCVPVIQHFTWSTNPQPRPLPRHRLNAREYLTE